LIASWRRLWQDGFNAFLQGGTMPRASTFVFLFAALGLYIFGMSTPAQCALFLAMGCELAAWKRASDKLRAMRLARIVQPARRMRGRR
jgi:hypothetical protein